MPNVISYTPPWLSRPSHGWDMFAPKPSPHPKQRVGGQDSGKRRRIATRDSEAFVAVGNEIRWGDLVDMKEEGANYKTLRIGVGLPITQLVVSPTGEFMAVATSHTVHVVLLPDSKLLDDETIKDPIKVKTWQIGPTAHVLEESPVASLLWHPLGYQGRCLITITREGVIRLWEINRTDRSSFSENTLSIDLQKLANATSYDQELSASNYGASKGFSPDSVELEVASACFGDYPDQEGVHGWAPMTLWIAMVEGDLYALCPLLPSKWQLPESSGALTVLQTLTTSINASAAGIDDADMPQEERDTAQRQLSWLADILYADPLTETLPSGDPISVFNCPKSVPQCPRLQGPFTLSADDVEDFEISDIIVYSLKTFSESTDEIPAEGLPAAVVCILTDTSEVHVCLDLQGIVGRWLPESNDEHTPLEPVKHELIVAETMALTDNNAPSFNQSITPDVQTDFSFFVSHSEGVFYISLESWIHQLENELAEPQSEGLDFRLSRILESATTVADQILTPPTMLTRSESKAIDEVEVNACAVIANGNLGYFVLTAMDGVPVAVTLDAPEHELPTDMQLYGQEMDLPVRQPRPTFQVPNDFYEGSLQFPSQWETYIPAKYKNLSKETMNLSPANLDILINVHKAMSADTHKLETAVSDLFIRCERLHAEFRAQVFQVAELVQKIDSATGNDEAVTGSDIDSYGNAKIEERLDRVKKRQEAINKRYEDIRRKMASVGGTELSERETGFIAELETMNRSLDRKAQTLADDPDGTDVPAWQRLEDVNKLQQDLTQQVEHVSQEAGEERAAGSVKVPSHSRRQEQEQIDDLLQRETALIEAAANRLRSNGISIPLAGDS